MSSIKLFKNGNGNLNVKTNGIGNARLYGKKIFKSYNSSFNSIKFSNTSWVYEYIDNVNNDSYGLSGPIDESFIYIQYQMFIHFFQVGEEILINEPGTFSSNKFIDQIIFYDSIPYADFGYGFAPDIITKPLRQHNIISKYLKFYPRAIPGNTFGHVAEVISDKRIVLIISDNILDVRDIYNNTFLGDFQLYTPIGSRYWWFRFNDLEGYKNIMEIGLQRPAWIEKNELPSLEGIEYYTPMDGDVNNYSKFGAGVAYTSL